MNARQIKYKLIDVGAFSAGATHGFMNAQGIPIEPGFLGYFSIVGPAIIRGGASALQKKGSVSKVIMKAQHPEVDDRTIDDVVANANPDAQQKIGKIDSTFNALGTGLSAAYGASFATVGYIVGYAVGWATK